MDMLKVSAKSARRVKSRKVWLEVVRDQHDEGLAEVDGEEGAARRENSTVKGEVRICWEKNWGGVGPLRQQSLPLSSLRDLRFGTSGSPYRTALHLSPDIEPRWLTLIYVLNPLASVGVNKTTGSSYKMVHFVAPTEKDLEVWKGVFEACGVCGVSGPGGGAGERGRRVSGTGIVLANGNGCANAGNGNGGGMSEETRKDSQSQEARVVGVEEVQRLVARLGLGMKKEEVAAAFIQAAAPNSTLDFPAFQNFVKLLKRRTDIVDVFVGLCAGAEGLSPDTWRRFLKGIQGSKLSDEAMSNLHLKYSTPLPPSPCPSPSSDLCPAPATPLNERLIRLEGFQAFLLSNDNPALKDESSMDMTRPLGEYFISSSHNTYLVGNQIQGESTVEGYIRALQRGCRSVELDIWDGDDGSPVVTHGRTLTSKLTAFDALTAIAKYAFLASTFPVILSLEIHCDVAQQDRLVAILEETLGEMLVKKRLDGGEGEVDRLPSPWELRGKVLIKAKNLFLTTSSGSQQLAMPVEGGPPLDSGSSTDSSSTSSDSDFKRVFKAVRNSWSSSRDTPSTSPSPSITTFSRSPSFNTPEPTVKVPKPPKPPMSTSLASLLVYTVGVKARGFNKKETYGVTHVLSFGENRLLKMIREEVVRQDLVAHNRGHLTRAYPKGIRLTSTNFLPHHLWAVGVQMVAINWQTFDLGLALNTAMFARAGRSGYVLKPGILRKKGPERDKDTLPKTTNYVLRLQVISAQQLPRGREDSGSTTMDPFVEVLVLVPGQSPIRKRTRVLSGNAFNPIFGGEFTIPFTTSAAAGMLDLVFLRLEVLNAKGNLKTAAEEGKGEFVGAYSSSLGSLLPGYRHLPLYDSLGDQHLFSTMFIRSSVQLVASDDTPSAPPSSLPPPSRSSASSGGAPTSSIASALAAKLTPQRSQPPT